MNNMEPEKELKIHPLCKNPDCHKKDRGGACNLCSTMEPEKKDVWEQRMRDDIRNSLAGVVNNQGIQLFTEAIIKNIRLILSAHTASIEAKYENCPQCTGLREEFRANLVEMVKEKKEWYSGGGNEPIRKVLDDVLDLLTQEK